MRYQLGAGGMGEVYYAEDSKLHRPVALKRVARELRHSGARQRIIKEAQRASALSSEHIACVYDVLEDLDEIFLVMEFVDGITLRRRLENTGRFALASFLPVATECAQALAEAQKKGILHRDIKPENIMLTEAGHIKILDFGLARYLPTANLTTVTATADFQTSNCAGTPGYMAPEVLLDQELDARADIFSLGVVFYEMLTAKHPFDSHKFMVTADHTLHCEPAPMRNLVDGIPQALERIVCKMLAKDRYQRYSNASELLVDLGALEREVSRSPFALPWISPFAWSKAKAQIGVTLAAVTLLFLLVFGLSHHWNAWLGIPQLPEKKHLAVLPFTAAGDDPSARAFSQGLTETLTTELVQLTKKYPLQVVSPSDVRTLAISSVEQARSGLGVNLVLEGNYHQSGTKVRVNYNLVDARTQRVLRADTITAEAADPFALEDRVVDSALRALDLELGAQERNALGVRGTNQPAAYDFYVRGRGYLQEYQRPESIESAIAVFTRALDRDPNFALAYAGLGESYWQKYELTQNREWVSKALQACQQAGAGDYGYSCLGTVYNGTGRYADAATQFQQVVQHDSSNQNAHRGLAFAYEHMGKMAEAEQTFRSAISVHPEYWGGYNWLGGFLARRGRNEEAATMFAQVIALAPDNVRGYSNLCGAYINLARFAEAIPVCQRSVSISATWEAYSNLGTAYFYQRRFREASHAYEQSLRLDDHQRSTWGNLGDSYYWDDAHRNQAADAYRKAITLGEEQLQVNRLDAELLSYLASYHAMRHETQAAWTQLKRARALDSASSDVQFNAALVENQLGEPGRAIQSLRKALNSGLTPNLIRDHPSFDNLHSNQRFQELLQAQNPAEQGKRAQ